MTPGRTRMRLCAALCGGLVAWSSSGSVWAQKLGAVRDAVRTPDSSPPRDDQSCEKDDDEGIVSALIGALIDGLTTVDVEFSTDSCGQVDTSYWFPMGAQQGAFARYPYADHYDGYAIPPGDSIYRHRSRSLRMEFSYGNDFDQLDWWNGRVQYDHRTGLGVEVAIDRYRESLPAGDDRLTLGQANATFRFWQSEQALWRVGAGMNWLNDGQSDFGINFTLQTEWFPRRPWVVAGQLDYGTLGHATLFHAQGTIGLLVDRFEFFTGYDYQRIDDAKLQGPLAGVRFWF